MVYERVALLAMVSAVLFALAVYAQQVRENAEAAERERLPEPREDDKI